MGPPEARSPAPSGNGNRAKEGHRGTKANYSNHYTTAQPILGPLRDVRPDELPDVRAVWWRMRRQGITLPAEAAVIVLDGGRA